MTAETEPQDIALERRGAVENDPMLREAVESDDSDEEFGFDDPTERFGGESPDVAEATERTGL